MHNTRASLLATTLLFLAAPPPRLRSRLTDSECSPSFMSEMAALCL